MTIKPKYIRSMYKYIKGKKIIAQLCIMLAIVISCEVAHAQSYNNRKSNPANQQGGWRSYPITLQINPGHTGLLMPLSLLNLPEEKPASKTLGFWGSSMDVSILYVNRTLWKYFDCYPRLGLSIDYHRLRNQGNIIGGVVYLEPNYNHSIGWEFLPRLGIGIAYAQIPGNHPYTPEEDEEMPEVEPFMESPSLDLALGFGIRYRLTPQWHIHTGLGLDYLWALTQEQEGDKPTQRKILTMYNLSLGGSYTFKPSPHNYARAQIPKKSRIDVAILNTFKKAQTPKSGKTKSEHSDANTASEDDKLYYVGGLYTQGSLRIANNHALTLATEWIKNGAVKKYIENKLRDTDLQVGALLGHEFLWGKLTFGQAAGAYFLNDVIEPPFGSVYTRLTLNYHITSFLFVGTSLKTAILPDPNTYLKFDYIDFRIGYSF
jgi:hypothetical protein